MLEVVDLVVKYGGHLAVDRLSVTIRPSRITALVGPNGAGKTSSLSAISGLVRPISGAVRLDERDVTGNRSHVMVRAGISHVPEGRKVIAPLTVEENLLLGAYARRSERAGIDESLHDVYEMFPILFTRRAARSGVLSGGEQQMLAFGRSLMARPKYVLLDEPTMGLAPAVVGTVLDAVERLRDRGLGILMVEQNGAAVTDVADEIHLLERGVVRASGPTDAMASDEIMRALLGVGGRSTADVTPDAPETLEAILHGDQQETPHDG